MADLRPASQICGVPGERERVRETVTAGSCPPPDLSRALVSVIGCGLGCTPINQCAVHWPITCPRQLLRGLGSFCARSIQALRSKSRKLMMMPQGLMAKSWSTPCFLVLERTFESNMVRQWDRMPRGKR